MHLKSIWKTDDFIGKDWNRNKVEIEIFTENHLTTGEQSVDIFNISANGVQTNQDNKRGTQQEIVQETHKKMNLKYLFTV